MATISKRGKRWQAQVYIDGKRYARTFRTRVEAREWSIRLEYEKRVAPIEHTFYEALERYKNEVAVYNKGARWDTIRIKKLKKDPLADVLLDDLKPPHIAEWRDRRLKEVKPSSVNRELNLISAVLSRCAKEWGWMDDNPVASVKRPRNPPPRDRRVSDEEVAEIYRASHRDDIPVLLELAIETGMRLSELTGIQPEDVDNGIVQLTDTKNGTKRQVPLSLRAEELLESVGNKFDINAQTASVLFRRVVQKTDIKDLTFHDSRHEACWRLSKVMKPQDLARMMGWKNLSMIMRYYNPTADELRDQLRNASAI
jgi:integrase